MELKEKLAAIEHERWADWQKWVHKTCEVETAGNPVAPTGRLIISYENVERWERQIATDYADLSEGEKQSDCDQVDRYWPLIEDHIKTTASPWIPVEDEGMPETAQMINVLDDADCVYACRYYNGNAESMETGERVEGVTKWMPIPE